MVVVIKSVTEAVTGLGYGFAASGDGLIVLSGVTLSNQGGFAVWGDFARTNISVTLMGTLVSAAATALQLEGANCRVVVGATGMVTSEFALGGYPTVALSGVNASFANHGTILSASGLAVAFSASGASGYNDGTITGGSFGVRLSGLDSSFVNDGTITRVNQGPYSFAALSLEGATSYLENSGLISAVGANYGVYVGQAGSRVVNSGRIVSSAGVGFQAVDSVTLENHGFIGGSTFSVSLSNFGDTVINTGTLSHNVDLMGGADLFDGRGGVVVGEVRGGEGGDTFYTSDPDLKIVEISGATGTDTVLASVNFALTNVQYIEVLSLVGTATVATGNTLAQTINGNHLANLLSGLAGNDTVVAGAGADMVLGGANNDSVLGQEGADTLDGGAGADTLQGDDGDDVLRGRTSDDRLDGGADDDRLVGGGGIDTLLGNLGDDTLAGGAGADLMYGGTEADTFVFSSVSDSRFGLPHDTIASDFLQGTDMIDLSAMDAKALTSGNDAFTFIGTAAFAAATAGQVRYVVVGANIQVQADVNGDAVADFEVQVNGQTSITAASFVL